ncbi:S1/P1 nuclease-domain-containing protein [Catenaria anguillulae PL171]|uniref:S1/P1 nuclease-domain-containing protein n=1 Tax=Catenaria anguillulae PL171 TaxID=765915 RepID=A0A1Y2HRL8_9FUNG|nr:S1/P1 nuclease-domain-containing protein [Catenaria anguillulae PL171]
MANFKLLAILAFTAVVANLSEPVAAWGEEGHRAVARIGYSLLTPKAKATVDELLKAGNYTLDSAATWPDTIRKTIPRYSTSGEWHYIDAHDNPPEGNCAAVAYPGDCPEGRCIISALAKAAFILADTKPVLAKRNLKSRPTFDKFGRPIPQLPEEQPAEQQQQHSPEEQQKSVYPETPNSADEPVAKEPETKHPEPKPAVIIGKHKKKCRPRRKHTTTAVVAVELTQGLEPTKIVDMPTEPGKQTQVVVDERAPDTPQTPTQVAEQPAASNPQQPTQPCEQPTAIVPKPYQPQEPAQVIVDVPSKPKPSTDVEPKPHEPTKTQIAESQQPTATEPFEGDQDQGPHQGEPTATGAPAEGQCTTTYYYGKPGKHTKTITTTTTCGGGASETVAPPSSSESATLTSAVPTTASASGTTTSVSASSSQTTTFTSVASTTASATSSTSVSATTTTTTATATASPIPNPNPNEPHPIINIGSKAEALSFLIHFSGDISQPEHTSGYLRGGNGFNVTVNGKRSNLHSAWDGAFIRESIAKDFGGKWDAWVDHLQKQALTADEARNIACGSKLTGTDVGATEKCTLDWAQDTVKFVCGTVFQGIKDGDEVLGGEYYKKSLEVTNRQIIKGGHRMAAVLNKLFG